jgi:hypothetical protein
MRSSSRRLVPCGWGAHQEPARRAASRRAEAPRRPKAVARSRCICSRVGRARAPGSGSPSTCAGGRTARGRRRTHRGDASAQHRPGAANAVLVGDQLVETDVVDREQPELLEVRVRVAPAAPLIEPDAVGEDLAQRALGLLRWKPLQVQAPATTRRDVSAGSGGRSPGPLLGDAELVAAQARRRAGRARRGNPRGSGSRTGSR